ncbi:hypothetical protein QBC40DRAFT_70368 [Triangularia verruculosa]|uniref:Uncharacterized protein n=1 Tax=Triangularia verruculosa TaxID=2587418 RepID=A0AAN7AVR5_9PEZI|nr:hypothetical protein QBC40DRAFT_70368 [Triangularia verruculosa]
MMEQQTNEFPPLPPLENSATYTETRDKTQPAASTSTSSLDDELTSSSPALRFPKPQGSQVLANWISSSSPDIMKTTAEPTNLADSAYEIINPADTTDSESQDGRMTESTSSLCAGRSDDVHSLDGSDHQYTSESDGEMEEEDEVDDEDDDEEVGNSSHASSIKYADEALENPSTHLPTANLEYGSSSEGSGVVVRAIEFQEDSDEPLMLEKISVKHAVREYNEDESASLALRLKLKEPPKHVVATIHQTMSRAYLSTKAPLRIVYVGRPDAQRSVVLKISSAIWASPSNGDDNQDHSNRDREGVYNIVPISSFGSSPELDLMHASPCQIKVEHCTSAEEVIYEGGSFPSDTVYSITVEHDKMYTSISSPGGSAIQPRYILPHIAVFYCSQDDDADAERTRDAAWCFMNRHGVPSIFISEKQDFAKSNIGSWNDYVNEHAIHLCLESRDPERPMPSQRFPIDLASFNDIDARQMNRNLAYLTGLSEPQEESFVEVETAKKEMPEVQMVELLDTARQAWAKFVERIEPQRFLPLLLPLLLALCSPYLMSVFNREPSSAVVPSAQTPLAGNLGSTPVCVASPLSTKSTSRGVSTTTKTVVVSLTETKTVEASQSAPLTSSLASALSYAGLLSDRSLAPVQPEAEKQETKKPAPVAAKIAVLSANIVGPNEILVDMPSNHKARRLLPNGLNVNVLRGDVSLESEAAPVDQGLLIKLLPKDAYGAVNITVFSIRKPKINETFEVDLGRTGMADAFGAGLHMLQDVMKKVSIGMDEATSQVGEGAGKVQGEVANAFKHALEAGKSARSQTAKTLNQATNSAKEQLSRSLKTAGKLQGHADLSILQAQIKSKLLWLKLQGKMEEHDAYQRNATRFLKMKQDELARVPALRDQSTSKSALCGKTWFPYKGHCKKAGQNTEEVARDSRWKKMIMG